MYFTNTALENQEFQDNALSYPSDAALVLNAIIVEGNNLRSELSFAQELEYTNRFGWLLGSSCFPLGKAARAAWAGADSPALLPPIQVTSTAKRKLETTPRFTQKAARSYRFEGFNI